MLAHVTSVNQMQLKGFNPVTGLKSASQQTNIMDLLTMMATINLVM